MRMFEGLISRWVTPFKWRNSIPWSISAFLSWESEVVYLETKRNEPVMGRTSDSVKCCFSMRQSIRLPPG
jgi:hypothetical protein